MKTPPQSRADTAPAARYYPVARVAHLERLEEMVPADFFYSEHRADWDENLAVTLGNVCKVTFRSFLAHVWRARYSTIEIPEPLAAPVIPKMVVLSWVLSLKRRFQGHQTALVTYAIENLDISGKVSAKLRIPRPVAHQMLRLLLKPVMRHVKRIAFGTEGAQENYRSLLGQDLGRGRQELSARLFTALPSPLQLSQPKSAFLVCFLGSFEERKGVTRVLDAWPMVKASIPNAELIVMGHGPLEDRVRKALSTLEGAELEVDPARTRISTVLTRSRVLVLPSERTATWREQVGLPIVEALAHGCEIVTSTETGLSSWLVAHGHRALALPMTPTSLASALAAALREARTPEDIQNHLPRTDSRIEADRWLFSVTNGNTTQL